VFDAAMATITVHQWPELGRGLAEMRRVTRGPVVILCFDSEEFYRFWLAEYVPELFTAARRRDPPIGSITAALGGRAEVVPVPIPTDCTDGFVEAYFARPEAFLDPVVRASQSSWGFVAPEVVELGIERLRRDLASGAWEDRHGALRTDEEHMGSLRLVVGGPA